MIRSTLQDHLVIVILHHLVVINKFLYGIRLLVIGQDKLGFQIHMDIRSCTRPRTSLWYLLLRSCFIVYHQAVELIDILIGLLTVFSLRIVPPWHLRSPPYWSQKTMSSGAVRSCSNSSIFMAENNHGLPPTFTSPSLRFASERLQSRQESRMLTSRLRGVILHIW